MKYHLILTLDYEVFGNGSGSLCQCVVEPVNRLLTLLKEHQAGLQCFVDATEFAAMSAHASAPNAPFEVASLQRVKSQISSLMSAPHSAHLHLHPQWMGASIAEDTWALDYGRWRIGDLSRIAIDEAVSSGMHFLNSLNGQFTQQRALCFRAGGWAIQPSQEVLSSLETHGIKIDSTVAPGALNLAHGDWFDFRSAPDKPFWFTNGDVLKESHSGFLEVPIATAKLGRLEHARGLSESRKNGGFPDGCSGSYAGPNGRLQSIAGKVSKIANLGNAMLDFSALPAWALIEITRRYMERFAHTEGPIPIVAIGHNKNFSQWSEQNLKQYLEWVDSKNELSFSSYRQWFDEANIERMSAA